MNLRKLFNFSPKTYKQKQDYVREERKYIVRETNNQLLSGENKLTKRKYEGVTIYLIDDLGNLYVKQRVLSPRRRRPNGTYTTPTYSLENVKNNRLQVARYVLKNLPQFDVVKDFETLTELFPEANWQDLYFETKCSIECDTLCAGKIDCLERCNSKSVDGCYRNQVKQYEQAEWDKELHPKKEKSVGFAGGRRKRSSLKKSKRSSRRNRKRSSSHKRKKSNCKRSKH